MTIQEKASAAAGRYVSAINNQDLDALLCLFDEKGRLNHPFGVFEGKESLAAFYGGLVMPAHTTLTVSRQAAQNNICMIEVAGVSPQAPDTPQYAIDLFEVNEEGKIVELSIYYRNFDLGK